MRKFQEIHNIQMMVCSRGRAFVQLSGKLITTRGCFQTQGTKN